MKDFNLPPIGEDTAPADWLFIQILGGCGCGNGEDFGLKAVELLKHFCQQHKDRKIKIYDDPFFELMAHWFEDKDLIEHGSSIAGSWLSEKGHKALEMILDAEKREKENRNDASITDIHSNRTS